MARLFAERFEVETVIESGMVGRMDEFGQGYGGGDAPWPLFPPKGLDGLTADAFDGCRREVSGGNGPSDVLIP